MTRFFATLSFALIFPLVASAQVVITEIMYDLEGSDSGREWAEIHNGGSGDVDISDWRFNDGSNHTLVISPEKGGQGSLTLSAGAYAILASDALQFLSEHTGFVGTVIDTVMGLNNTSEVVSLIDRDGASADIVSYNSELGANGDGNSLQKINGAWVAATPTPGSSASSEEVAPRGVVEATSESSQTAAVSYVSAPEKTITTKIQKREALAIVGAATEFSGLIFGLEGEPITSGARFMWNFGDGVTVDGERVLHTFSYPGEYVVVLEGSSGKYANSDRMAVRASEVSVFLSREEGAMGSFIKIENDSPYEINISGWIIKGLYKHFVIPKNTFIASKKSTVFSKEVLGLDSTSYESAVLLYPNGAVVVQNEKDESSVSVGAISVETKKQTKKEVESKTTALGVVVEEVLEKDTFKPEENLVASPAKSGAGGRVYRWLMGLLGIIGIALASVYVVRHEKQEEKSGELSADDFKVIEEK